MSVIVWQTPAPRRGSYGDRDGNLVVAGSYWTGVLANGDLAPDAKSHLATTRMSQAGTLSERHAVPSAESRNLFDFDVDDDGRIYLVGRILSKEGSWKQSYFTVVTQSGTPEPGRTAALDLPDVTTFALDGHGGAYLAGRIEPSGNLAGVSMNRFEAGDMFLLRLHAPHQTQSSPTSRDLP